MPVSDPASGGCAGGVSYNIVTESEITISSDEKAANLSISTQFPI